MIKNLANDRMVYSISLPTHYTDSTGLRYEAMDPEKRVCLVSNRKRPDVIISSFNLHGRHRF